MRSPKPGESRGHKGSFNGDFTHDANPEEHARIETAEVFQPLLAPARWLGVSVGGSANNGAAHVARYPI